MEELDPALDPRAAGGVHELELPAGRFDLRFSHPTGDLEGVVLEDVEVTGEPGAALLVELVRPH